MGTITTTLKVDADARAAVSGLKPLQASLEEVQEDAEASERALEDLDKTYRIDLNESAIRSARDEIEKLQRQMREDIAMGLDTKVAQRRIRELKSAIRLIEADDIDLDVDVDDSDLHNMDASLGGIAGRSAVAAGAVGGLTGSLSELGRTTGPIIGSVVGIFAGLSYVIGKTAGASLSLADQMENATIAFTQFLGSEGKANKFLGDLEQFAAKTPFEFPELVESSKRLLAFGLAGDDVIEVMSTLGDAAALTGASVDELASIWGQMAAKGKVSNEELLQLTENGIPAYDALAEAMGKTPAEIQKMAEEGKLLSTTTLPLLKRQLDETFGGGMAKQAETLSGKWSTLKDTLAGTGRELGAALLPFATAILDDIQPALENLTAWMKENKGAIATAITTGGASVIEFEATMIRGMGSLITAIGDVIGWVGQLTLAIGIAGQSLSDMPGVPDDLGDDAVEAGAGLIGLGEDTKAAGETLHGVADGLDVAAGKFRDFGEGLAETFRRNDIKASIRDVKGEIARLAEKPPTPRITAKIEAAQEKLRELREDLDDATADRDVDINANIDEDSLARVRAVFAELTKDRVVDLWIEGHRSGAGGQGGPGAPTPTRTTEPGRTGNVLAPRVTPSVNVYVDSQQVAAHVDNRQWRSGGVAGRRVA